MPTAADAIGISVRTAQHWRANDPQFDADCNAAEEESNARLRQRVLERIPHNDLLLMFEMKRRDPAYKDNTKLEVNVGVQVGDWQSAASAFWSKGEPPKQVGG